ncbi:hypothetical protein ACGFW5_31005 [Streptomyces sp. NPDC048416]|uniref:hypothetical protein n=1 Tax=Streptomyces sp. NPDC048416 TaxID=3365546 RepID=UPI0037204C10
MTDRIPLDALASDQLDALHERAEQAEAARDAVYRERAHLVAHLAALYPSHIGYTDPSAPDWPVLIIEAPGGQLSWHIAPNDVGLFAHVRRTDRICRGWDGHATDEKYERLDRLTSSTIPLPLDDDSSGPYPTRQQVHDHAEQQVRAAAQRLRASVGCRVLDALNTEA